MVRTTNTKVTQSVTEVELVVKKTRRGVKTVQKKVVSPKVRFGVGASTSPFKSCSKTSHRQQKKARIEEYDDIIESDVCIPRMNTVITKKVFEIDLTISQTD
jgi:hypothetical protein